MKIGDSRSYLIWDSVIVDILQHVRFDSGSPTTQLVTETIHDLVSDSTHLRIYEDR
jgi:hypothetical protein